ncbi:MAG: hypothetical protein ACLQMT_06965 [Candidatus Acidiferrales bacterium]
MRPEIFILLSILSVAPRAARDLPVEKVWTNPDVRALRATSPISIVGAIPTAEANKSASGYRRYVRYVKEDDPAWYAAQIDSLRETIEEADAEIQTVENILKTGEGITDAVSLDKLAVGVTPRSTIEMREREKSALEAEIEGLQDQARELDIPAEAWR